MTEPASFSRRQTATLLASILVVALCGIVYELIIAAVGSYLLGNSVVQFSLTIGLFMFSMGVGSYLSRHVHRDLLTRFVQVEIAISLIGGLCSLALFVTFAWSRPLYPVVMYGSILLIGGLVGIEIPLLTRMLSTNRDFKDALAEVFSLDYLGALIGSVAFPLLILPELGLVRSSFVVGLLNVLVAFVNVWVFRDLLPRPRRLAAITGTVAVLLVVGTVVGTRLTTFLEQRLYADTIVYRTQSPYQRIVLTHSSVRDEHRLYIDGHLQFAERDEYRYHEALVHPAMALPSPRGRILILGGGDGLTAREVFRWPEVASVDLVDIDPAITETCRTVAPIARLNGRALDDPRLILHHEDAFAFVREVREPYDRIFVDLPDPHNETLNKLYSREFYRLLRRALVDGGALASQSASPYLTRRSYWCIAATMAAADLHTASYHVQIPSFGIWGFHVASRADIDLDEGAPLPDGLRFVTREWLRVATIFPPDMARVDVPPNTMHTPALYQLYNQDLRN